MDELKNEQMNEWIKTGRHEWWQAWRDTPDPLDQQTNQTNLMGRHEWWQAWRNTSDPLDQQTNQTTDRVDPLYSTMGAKTN